MVFETGDAVFHPMHGAGVVTGIKDRMRNGEKRRYYVIELLGLPGTGLMVPIGRAKEMGLRSTMSQTELKEMWRVLRGDPQNLPKDHKDRYAVIEEKLHSGGAFAVAAAVRDMAWRWKQEGALTTKGRRIYEEAVKMLAGEIAVVQEIELLEAERQVHARLQETPAVASLV